MRRIILFVGLYFLVACTYAAEINTSLPQPKQDELVRQVVSRFMRQNEVPGVAVVLYVNGTPKAYYFGYADKEKKTPITKQTIFELGSISKVMTSLLLAQQVDLAKTQLDRPVTTYLPDLPAQYEDMTLVNFATHTAGLPLMLPQSVNTQAALDQYLTKLTSPYKVDDEWVYSNIGIGLLGLSLEKITHQNLPHLYHYYIASPLKMTTLGLTISSKNKKYLATGYNEQGMPVQPIALSVLPAAGDLKSSVDDMRRFLSAAIGLPDTPEAVFYPMRMTQSSYIKLADAKQGLGWMIHSLKVPKLPDLLAGIDVMRVGPLPIEDIYEQPKFNGNTLIDKTGTTDGFRAYIAVVPNRQAGIVVLANKRLMNPDLIKAAREILFKTTGIIAVDEAEDETSEKS